MKTIVSFLLCVATVAYAEDMRPNDTGYDVAMKAVEAVSGSISPCPGFVDNVLFRPRWLCATMPDAVVFDEAIRAVMDAYPYEIYYQEGGRNVVVTGTTHYRGKAKKVYLTRFFVLGKNNWPSDVEIGVVMFPEIGKRWIAVNHGTYEGFCWVGCD